MNEQEKLMEQYNSKIQETENIQRELMKLDAQFVAHSRELKEKKKRLLDEVCTKCDDELEKYTDEFKHVRFEMEQRQRQNNREKSLIYLAMQSGKPYTDAVVETGHEVELINEMEG